MAYAHSQPDASNQIRLNLLVSYGGWREESWADQLPRLLDPLGVRSIRVRCGREAADVIESTPVHIAVVDLAIPFDLVAESSPQQRDPAGMRILQVLRRLSQPPPTVVVRDRQADARASSRSLGTALREGAFAVLDAPVQLESLLKVLRRIVRRHYADSWPV